MNTRPNILMICTDQQRWDTLGATGNPFVSTPDVDGLYAGGAAVENAYCQAPICTPSRGSFLTGRYPRTCGIRQNGQDIEPTERLLPKILSDAGYTCGLAGKLHISACHPSVADYERRIADGYDVFHWSHHPAASLADQAAGTVHNRTDNWPLNEYNVWLSERGEHYDATPLEGCEHVQIGPDRASHQTTWCAQKAIDFINAHRGTDVPWMFSINMFDPHHPFDPPREYLDRYMDRLDEIPLPPYVPGELDNKPRFQEIDHHGAYGHKAGVPYATMSEHDHRMVRAAYYAMCDLISDETGRIVAALEEAGVRENTLVIFMSDHGEMLGDHGIYLKGPFFYEPAVKVPLCFNMPGTIPAQSVPGLFELIDIAPTIVEAAGLPEEPGMQGKSVWKGLCEGNAKAVRDSVYCEFYGAMPWHDEWGPSNFTMVRNERYKIVVDHGSDRGELYDLAEDPGEHTNLWDDPASVATKAEMLVLMTDRMFGTVDPLPVRRALW